MMDIIKPKGRRPKVKEAHLTIERNIALEYRKAGLSYDQIGEKMKCSHQKAYELVAFELKRIQKISTNEAEELRRIQLERMNRFRVALTPKAQHGDVEAIKAMLKIDEREAKILGLDAPEKHEVKSENLLLSFTVTDEQRKQIADSLLKKC